MNGEEHKKADYFIGFLAILYFFSRINQYGYGEFIPLGKFLLGVVVLPFLFSPDLDSPESIVTQMWGPFKIIWRPFVTAGHREILHNIFWGPFILICSLWVPLHIAGYEFWIETVLGMIASIECHIIYDKLF
jgi:uncharacterized metal-binding protein